MPISYSRRSGQVHDEAGGVLQHRKLVRPIVDDEPVIRLALAIQLQEKGCELLEARWAASVITAVQNLALWVSATKTTTHSSGNSVRIRVLALVHFLQYAIDAAKPFGHLVEAAPALRP